MDRKDGAQRLIASGPSAVTKVDVASRRDRTPFAERNLLRHCNDVVPFSHLGYAGELAMASRYGKKASAKVSRAMHKRKEGTLKSGSGKRVRSRKQAIAIGLSEARKAGGKVPSKKSARSSTTRRRKTSSRARKSS